MGQCTSKPRQNRTIKEFASAATVGDNGGQFAGAEDEYPSIESSMKLNSSSSGMPTRNPKYMTSDGYSDEEDEEEVEEERSGLGGDPALEAFIIDFGGGELPSLAEAAARKRRTLPPRLRQKRGKSTSATRTAAAVPLPVNRSASLGRDVGRRRKKRQITSSKATASKPTLKNASASPSRSPTKSPASPLTATPPPKRTGQKPISIGKSLEDTSQGQFMTSFGTNLCSIVFGIEGMRS